MIQNTFETGPAPKRGRVIFIAVAVLLAALAVWKVIDYRSQPPPAVFTPTPEGLEALGYLTEARNAANSIDGYIRLWLLGNIAGVHVKAGDLPGAREIAYAMPEEYQPSALARIAAAQAENGDFVGARATIKSIKNGGLLGIFKSENIDKGEALLALARAQARAGDIAGSKATARSIKRDVVKKSALCVIAIAQAKAGDIAGAKATANEIGIEHYHASPLIDIVMAQLKAGDRAGASESFDRAEAQAKAVKEDHKDVILGHIARAEAMAGDMTRARTTADSIRSFVKAGVMREIAAIQATAGDIAEARAIANSLSEIYGKAMALAEVALAQAKAGDQDGANQTFDQAKTVANGETAEQNKDAALCYIATLQAKAGDVAGAKATAGAIKDPDIENLIFSANTKPFMLRALAVSQARAEGFPAAENWVKTVSEPFARALCYIALAETRLNPNAPENEDIVDED
jgi:tetratricopeptide (TPR) repeat protein